MLDIVGEQDRVVVRFEPEPSLERSHEIDDSHGLIPGSICNDTAAIVQAIVQSIESPESTLVVCEGTGGYERKLASAMHVAGVPIVVANPRQVRDFASGNGIREKSDPIDASVLRAFGEDARNLVLAMPNSEDEEKLGAMARRRKQLLQMINQESNRLEQTVDREIAGLIKENPQRLK